MKLADALDPYSFEVRYTLDYVCYLVSSRRPERVGIVSPCSDMCLAIMRRLMANGCHFSVLSPQIQIAAREELGLEVDVQGYDGSDDLLVYPFSLEQGMPVLQSRFMVAAVRNSLSYKRLLHPRAVATNVMTLVRSLKKRYQISIQAGAFHPTFLLVYGAALAVAGFAPSVYFQLTDRAMTHYFFCRGSLWRLSYVVILHGERIV